MDDEADVPLPSGLGRLAGRVAELWVDGRLDGYLFLDRDVWTMFTGPFWNRKPSLSIELLEFILIRLDSNGQFVEMVDSVIREDVEELARDRFTLRGVEGRLVWLDEPAGTAARKKYLE